MNDIPIIGQPVTVLGWFATALVACNCLGHGKQTIVVLHANHVTPCTHCKKGYRISKIDGSNVSVDIFLATNPNGSQPQL